MQGRVGDPTLVADADTAFSEGQLDIGFGDRRLRDGRHDTIAGSQLPEQGGLVRSASIDRDPPWWSGGRRRPDHASHSRRCDVASTYVVFDMPTICCRPGPYTI